MKSLWRRLFIQDNDIDTMILVTDDTHISIRKSANCLFQWWFISLHKRRRLIKPSTFVTTSGYILKVSRLYFADSKSNDANLFTHILKKDVHNIKECLKLNDVRIIDRCFWDCLEPLQEMDFEHEMPKILNK